MTMTFTKKYKIGNKVNLRRNAWKKVQFFWLGPGAITQIKSDTVYAICTRRDVNGNALCLGTQSRTGRSNQNQTMSTMQRSPEGASDLPNVLVSTTVCASLQDQPVLWCSSIPVGTSV